MMTFEAEYYGVGILDNREYIMMNTNDELYTTECEYCGRVNEFYKKNSICDCGCPLNIKKATKIDQSKRAAIGASGTWFINYPAMSWPISYNETTYNADVINRALNIVKQK